MKNIIVIILSVFLISCQKEVEEYQYQERIGNIIEIDSDEPFVWEMEYPNGNTFTGSSDTIQPSNVEYILLSIRLEEESPVAISVYNNNNIYRMIVVTCYPDQEYDFRIELEI